MKNLLRFPVRHLQHRLGFDLVHHSAEPAVRFASEARKAIRLDPGHRLPHAGQLGWRLYMSKLLPALDIDGVIDVGANTGQFRTALRDLGYAGPVHSFEPIPELAERLNHAAAQDPAWHVYAHALGAETEDRLLHILADDALSSLHAPAPEAAAAWSQAKTRMVREINVPVRRLESFLCDPGPASGLRSVFLKIDTQGSDLAVLLGSGRGLDRVRAIQFEAAVRPAYHDAVAYPEIVAWLESRGFVLGGMFPICHQGLRLVEFDCLMIRETAP